MNTTEAGRLGAQRRWGPRRRINIKDLDPKRREIVLAFVEAERNAQKRERQSSAKKAQSKRIAA